MSHITIAHQVAGVEALRDHVAARAGTSDPRLDAALATLKWIAENEAGLRAVAAELVALKRDPAVAAVLETFPGAVIAAVRSVEPGPC